MELQVFKEIKMEKGKFSIEFWNREARSNKEMMLDVMAVDGRQLQYASYELRSDKEVVMAAVKENGYALRWASSELKADKDVVMEAVKQDGGALQFASFELFADRDVVLAVVSNYGGALRYASPELKADRAIMMEAVKNDGYALAVASDELKDDKEVVLAAIKEEPEAFQFASDRLKDDIDVVITAMRQNGGALNYASKRIKEVVASTIQKADEEKQTILNSIYRTENKVFADESKSIRDTYMKEYPTDELGEEIEDISIGDVWKRFKSGEDIYDVLGVDDSVIRKRVFDVLSESYGVDYDNIYELWLANGDDVNIRVDNRIFNIQVDRNIEREHEKTFP